MSGRDEDAADLALLRRIIIGLQEDQATPRRPAAAQARIDGARALVDIVAQRHRETVRAGSDWALAIEHVHRLCEALERHVAAEPGAIERRDGPATT